MMIKREREKNNTTTTNSSSSSSMERGEEGTLEEEKKEEEEEEEEEEDKCARRMKTRRATQEEQGRETFIDGDGNNSCDSSSRPRKNESVSNVQGKCGKQGQGRPGGRGEDARAKGEIAGESSKVNSSAIIKSCTLRKRPVRRLKESKKSTNKNEGGGEEEAEKEEKGTNLCFPK